MTTNTYTGWRKSTRSEDGNCVEVAKAVNGSIGVRDSQDPTGPVLDFDRGSWTSFTDDIHTGRFDR
ncbi:DUF397 domain-containing protein [Dactylosporangium sp. McL0621]|uniref:DUF397 domain-containing protein n=1 Tax=Dactylosporangium sp. McL0621 TaxID=3415678 RepID=UPI003CF30F1E